MANAPSTKKNFPAVDLNWYPIFPAKKMNAEARRPLTQFFDSPPEETSMTFAYGETAKKRGRPTLDDSTLTGRRDRLVWLLSVVWGDIGWELSKSKKREELYRALSPLAEHNGRDIVAIFLRSTAIHANNKEVRKLRKELGNAVDFMHSAYQQQEASRRLFQQAEAAIKMHRVDNAQTEFNLDPNLDETVRAAIVSVYEKRKTDLLKIESSYAESCVSQASLRNELEEKESAFAQSELLDYIDRAKYARNPLGLANAMAGLPDLGWSQSHSRCSKIRYIGWPTLWFSEFETIRHIWENREISPGLSLTELFRQEVTKMPTKILCHYEPKARKIWMPNQLRTRLADNFRLLRLAIEETLYAKMHPGQVPFVITSRFEKNMDKQRTASEDLLIAHERLE